MNKKKAINDIYGNRRMSKSIKIENIYDKLLREEDFKELDIDENIECKDE